MISTRIRRSVQGAVFAAAAAVATVAAPAFASIDDPTTGAKAAAADDAGISADKRKYCLTVARKGDPKGARAQCKTRAEWVADIGVDPGKK